MTFPPGAGEGAGRLENVSLMLSAWWGPQLCPERGVQSKAPQGAEGRVGSPAVP